MGRMANRRGPLQNLMYGFEVSRKVQRIAIDLPFVSVLNDLCAINQTVEGLSDESELPPECVLAFVPSRSQYFAYSEGI